MTVFTFHPLFPLALNRQEDTGLISLLFEADRLDRTVLLSGLTAAGVLACLLVDHF